MEMKRVCDIVIVAYKDNMFRHYDINHRAIATAHTMNTIQIPNLVNDCTIQLFVIFFIGNGAQYAITTSYKTQSIN